MARLYPAGYRMIGHAPIIYRTTERMIKNQLITNLKKQARPHWPTWFFPK